jgi:hypothetical protein
MHPTSLKIAESELTRIVPCGGDVQETGEVDTHLCYEFGLNKCSLRKSTYATILPADKDKIQENLLAGPKTSSYACVVRNNFRTTSHTVVKRRLKLLIGIWDRFHTVQRTGSRCQNEEAYHVAGSLLENLHACGSKVWPTYNRETSRETAKSKHECMHVYCGKPQV